MARLVHLNGPPGVGKSTHARRWAPAHPKALALDTDVVVTMIGGWRDDFWGTLPLARRLAAAMAHEHLAAGHDVLLPQLVTSPAEIAPYLAAAENSGAAYLEVVLLADLDTTVQRLSERAVDGEEPWGRHLEQIIAENGGVELLVAIRSDLAGYLDGRDPLSIDTTGRTAEETYRQVESALLA